MAAQGIGIYVIEVSAFNGMDAIMRLSNMARRAKLEYRNISASFDGRVVRMRIEAVGEEKEVRWLAAKMERMPEVYAVAAKRLS
ncbi:hypothetical protein Pyrde_1929 [Pyrodictium delaneyi]|uniref:ACT domain-containing protein n=1 Tax=Pyrodictium delaneyi TaxID=1273541 RepID=A0A0P0N5A6_9CREN|nr:ACT domain-containing protein [Pyrodictium delaneyi]ALL01972.1 hypothetical protein Pyrde_1929 [Pyrodictium delaneyi]OWJ54859.1 hypothetical protein Pdsh_03870 [Pyrodictium delaneyi]